MSPFARSDGGVAWLESRDDDTRWVPQSNLNRSSNGIFQSATNQTTQQMFVNELKFSAAKSIRTSTIILAAFNMVAAFATALGILCDSYFRARRNNRKFTFRRNGFGFVPEGEVYPLVLSFGILFQSATFVGAQSTGLDSLFGRGCTTIAQLMLPAMFIVPYTQMVFGLEIAIRALRKQPFAPRGKYHTSICMAIIKLLTLANLIVAVFDRSPNSCLTSLFWFVAHYSVMCFALLVAITVIVLVCTIVIFVRLYHSIKVEVTARVSASRMVYYLALAVISNGFMVPFFFVQAFQDRRGQNSNALTLSMVASVVANVSGLMTGGLYLFLKSSTLSTIGPKDKAGEYENRKATYKIRRYESNDSDDDGNSDSHSMHPAAESRSLRRMDSEASLISIEKEEEALDKAMGRASTPNGKRSPDSIPSNKLMSIAATLGMPRAPEPARIPPAPLPTGHMRKRSYSLFPRSTLGSKSSVMLLPATTYSPSNNNNLKPPPSMANLANFRHRRDSSMVSSATVQIGLRLSSVDDMPPQVKSNVTTSDNEVYSLNCPNAPTEAETQPPKRPAGVDTGAIALPPPLAIADETPQRDPVKNARMKTLPPVPRINSRVPPTTVASTAGQNEITLSPSVYSPNTPTKVKLPSPKGVGFSMPVPKSSITGGGPGPAPRSPPRRTGTGGSTAPLLTGVKGDWI